MKACELAAGKLRPGIADTLRDLNRRMFEPDLRFVDHAVLDSEFENAPSEICDQVRPLFVTPKHPSHPLAARPDLPASVRRSVTQAVLQLGSRGTVPGVLKAVRLSDPVAADYARDYRELEEIDTEKLSSEKPL